MKQISLLLLFLLCFNAIKAYDKFCIKPKGYIETESQSHIATNHLSSMNKVGGYFRLKEFSAAENKVVETDIVTFFIAKNNETSVDFHINCAKQINLHYVLQDSRGKHRIEIREPAAYYRFEKSLDISSFKDGVCTLSVYNEKNELIHTIEFEKATL